MSCLPACVSLLACITKLPTDRRLERQISDMKKTDFFAAPASQVMASCRVSALMRSMLRDTQPVANSNNAEEDSLSSATSPKE